MNGGEYLYGRGVADDKGQLYLLLRAARGLARAGELPVNVRFVCDGEEETGGYSIVEYLQADDRGAAAAVIFDSGMIRKGLLALQIDLLSSAPAGAVPPVRGHDGSLEIRLTAFGRRAI